MPDYHYSYFVGSLLFLAAWVILYSMNRKLRVQMLWGSGLSAPFALMGSLFIPRYWSPPSLWNLDGRIGIGIEDIIFSVTTGGIAAALPQWLPGERHSPARTISSGPQWMPLLVIVAAFVGLHQLFPAWPMYAMIASFSAGVSLIAIRRPDLRWRMARGTAVFTVFYVALFACFLALYPDFVGRFYNTPNLLGWYLFGVPIEEVLFACSGSAVWSAIVNRPRLGSPLNRDSCPSTS